MVNPIRASLAALATAGLLLSGLSACTSGTTSDGQESSVVTDVTIEPGGLTATQQRAADQAVEIHKISPLSRVKLIERLTKESNSSLIESFSIEDATIAVDSLGIDWNEKAVHRAEKWLSYDLGFSRPQLIDALSGENGNGFTTEQAQRAVDRLDVDWVEQATIVAKERLEQSDYLSRTTLFDVMTNPDFRGFTEEQVNAALDGMEVDWYAQAANAVERERSFNEDLTCDEAIERVSDYLYEFTREQARVGATRVGVC